MDCSTNGIPALFGEPTREASMSRKTWLWLSTALVVAGIVTLASCLWRPDRRSYRL
jgi:hypothetical protein